MRVSDVWPEAASLLMLSIALLMLPGCASTPGARPQAVPTVAVLINRTWTEQDPRGFTWDIRGDEKDDEERFAACVSQAAASMRLPLNVVTGTRFRELAFPDLDPRAAPRNLDTLRSLMADPRFQARVDAAGVRYLAVLGGETRTSETKGGIFCSGGMGAGYCLGYLWWDHESRLSALIIDLHGGAELARSGLDASGTSWFAALVVLPLAAPSLHESRGCTRFGEAVVGALGDMRRQDTGAGQRDAR
jgi:hypothetical protein